MTNAANGPPKKGMSGCVLAIVAVVVLLIILGCCGGGGWFIYDRYQRARAATVTMVDNLKNGESLPGGPVTLDGALPESFPKDIPVFDGLKPVEGVTTPDGGGQETFEGKADVNEVVAFYQQEMLKAGWDGHGGEGMLMKFSKDDRQATITVIGGSGRDVKVMMYYAKQEGAAAETINPGKTVITQPTDGGTKQPTDNGVAAEQPQNVTAEQTGGGAGTGGGTGGAPAEVLGKKLPSNFPSDVPVYEGMTVTLSRGNIEENKGSIIATGKVDREAVITFYKQKLKAAGFAVSTNVEVAEMTQISFTKADRTVSVQVSLGDNGLSDLMIDYSGK